MNIIRIFFFIFLLILKSCSLIDFNTYKKNQTRDIASNQDNCANFLSKPLPNLSDTEVILNALRWNSRKGDHLLIQRRGDSILEELKLQDVKLEESEIFLFFQEKNSNKIVKIKANHIHSSQKIKKGEKVYNKIDSIMMQPVLAETIGKLIFKPYRHLVKKETIEVVGNLLTSKKLGQKIANNMNDFDETMTSFGFIKPESTRVIINDSPVLPNLIGPFSLNYPVLNIWTGKPKKIIAMNPIFWKTNSIKDEAVLHHERMHALLHRTYNRNAFINKSRSFQEAFADFSAANFLDNPRIGHEAISKGISLRDISKKTTSSGKTEKAIDFITKVNGYNYHDDSLLVSNLLWQIRNQVGKNKVSGFIKPLIDDLNSFRKSFLLLNIQSQEKIKNPRQRFISDLEYFLAVLKKKGQDEPLFETILPLTNSYISQLGLNLEKINYIAISLKNKDESFNFSGDKNIKQGLIIAAYGTTGVLVKGYFIYEIFVNED